MVICDEWGQFMGAKSIQRNGSINSTRGELMAIREGTLFAKELGCSKICVESDCKESINKLIDELPDFSHNGSIVLDIFSFAQCFNAFYCSFVPWRFNCVADTLAKFATSSSSHVLTSSPPLFLETVPFSYLS